MRRKSFLGIISGMLTIMAVTLVLGSGAWAQVKYKTLHTFDGKDGDYPDGALTFDTAGNLYGAACNGGAYGNGVVFKLTPNADGSWTETSLHDFTGVDDGVCPLGSPIFDAAGNLYSVADGCCWGNTATVFELTPNLDGTWTFNVLYNFNYQTLNDPSSFLIFDKQGSLYGTTFGIVYKLTPNGDGTWNESTLYTFFGGRDGGHAASALLFDPSGNLYGNTQWGGSGNYNGVVFELTPNPDDSWTYKVLHRFSGGGDGFQGCAGMTMDAAGNLYGATMGGGTYGGGVAFKLAPQPGGGWKEYVLHQFTGGKDGGDSAFAAAACGLVSDAAGNLYGTRYSGGAHGYGVTYKLTPGPSGGWYQAIRHAFQDKPGAYPDGGVTLDAAGNIYGTTSGSGYTFGSVYEITP